MKEKTLVKFVENALEKQPRPRLSEICLYQCWGHDCNSQPISKLQLGHVLVPHAQRYSRERQHGSASLLRSALTAHDRKASRYG